MPPVPGTYSVVMLTEPAIALRGVVILPPGLFDLVVDRIVAEVFPARIVTRYGV